MSIVVEHASPPSFSPTLIPNYPSPPPHTHALTVTTDLQQFIVSLTSTTLDVTCTLAAGSSALGCNVIAVSAGDPTPFWSTNLTRSGDELELTMSFLLSELNAPSASFSVFAMDLEEDGSIGDLQFSAEAPTTPPPSKSCVLKKNAQLTYTYT